MSDLYEQFEEPFIGYIVCPICGYEDNTPETIQPAIEKPDKTVAYKCTDCGKTTNLEVELQYTFTTTLTEEQIPKYHPGWCVTCKEKQLRWNEDHEYCRDCGTRFQNQIYPLMDGPYFEEKE